ncbi:FAD/NAD(P)-binding domain-containing protein [Aspergillus heteromorphus CBS 117.55]|uniref:FAD/NAD(P)-binding domain-containing protein n=1 Tax=Aspergillus heteromorphus CBS 117.55 TaxID=1448321 RepID=A0A317VL11_9EURO|nr:FAD/NAD(P)-binding domain-containing protein [Aspergillus heteromorphus CBS 117.55]PWY75043.1 FAD/NAD(P)-binding domain-containing protein [Aspergillus heteromorphus CBS 117.55]
MQQNPLDPVHEFHVIIVGGAHGLQKSQHGISYIVVDRETGPRNRNWGVTINWAHTLLDEILPPRLRAELASCQPDESLDIDAVGIDYALIRNGATGEPIATPRSPGMRRLNIQKTKRNWGEGLDIHYGKKLVDIEVLESGVIAHFSDGTSETGTVIVGADGASSRVRNWLLGDEKGTPEVLPYAFMNIPTTYTAEQARYLESISNPFVDVGAHPKNMYMGFFLLDKPDHARPETWVFYILASWRIGDQEDIENSPNRLERLRRRMDGWADPFASAVRWLPDDTMIGADQLKTWQPREKWDNRGGRVTLAGDAAHTMTFHRGQGGNTAIRDAFEYVKAMVEVRDGKKELQHAVDVYDTDVFERGEEVERSRQAMMAFDDFANFTKSPVLKIGMTPQGTQSGRESS